MHRIRRSGGKAHLNNRRDISFENEVALRWPSKQKNEMKLWVQPTSTFKSIHGGLFYFLGQSLQAFLLHDYLK